MQNKIQQNKTTLLQSPLIRHSARKRDGLILQRSSTSCTSSSVKVIIKWIDEMINYQGNKNVIVNFRSGGDLAGSHCGVMYVRWPVVLNCTRRVCPEANRPTTNYTRHYAIIYQMTTSLNRPRYRVHRCQVMCDTYDEITQTVWVSTPWSLFQSVFASDDWIHSLTVSEGRYC